MKTLLKVLGTTALLASIIPFSHSKDEESGRETYQALLWKAVNSPDTDEENKRKLNISFGFNNPFSKATYEESHLFADDLTVTYHTAPVAEEAEAAAEAPAAEEAVPETPEVPDAPKATDAAEAPTAPEAE